MDLTLYGAPAPKSRVYILTDETGRVLRLEGEYSRPADLTGWTLIEEGPACDRLNLAQSHYLNGPLYDYQGRPRYRWDGVALQAIDYDAEVGV